jgi:hypothetical protein
MTVSDVLQKIYSLEKASLQAVQARDAAKAADLTSEIANRYELLGRKLQTEPYDRTEVSAFILRRSGPAQPERTLNS